MSAKWKPTLSSKEVLKKQVRIFTAPNTESFIIKVLNDEESKEQALDLIMHELNDDPIFSGLKLQSNPASLECLRNWIQILLNQGIACCCYLKETDVMVAVDLLHVRNPRDECPADFKKWKAFKIFWKYLRLTETVLERKRRHPCSNFLASLGIFVRRDYRDHDIQTNMIGKRKNIASTLGFKIIISTVYGEKMKTLANKHKYKTYNKLHCKELEDREFTVNHLSKAFPIYLMSVRFNPRVRNEPEIISD